jgi:ABC-type transport system involved in Fe-S cluster assembly fused permease/ATPase subunit
VELGGTLSYVAQQAWIQNATLRENITFADEHVDEEKLNRAIQSCALSTDLKQLKDGIDTEIGGESYTCLTRSERAHIYQPLAFFRARDQPLRRTKGSNRVGSGGLS